MTDEHTDKLIREALSILDGWEVDESHIDPIIEVQRLLEAAVSAPPAKEKPSVGSSAAYDLIRSTRPKGNDR